MQKNRPGQAVPGRVTLKTIAEATGLSLSTVSLSLRGGTTLKQETRDKVAAAAKALGYVPDRAGVRLRTGKTNVLALVLDGAEDSIDFARQMIQGIGQAIKGTPYHLTVTPEFDRRSTDTIRYILEHRNADGVIITHTGPRDPRVQMMVDANFPFVSHGRTEFFTPHPYHDFHAEAFATMAVERLAGKGCRKVMLVIGDDRTTNYHNIVTAFHKSAARNGLETALLESTRGLTPAELRGIGVELAHSADRPDGLICDSETRTIALLGGFMESGLVVGRDLHLVYKQTSGILPTMFPRLDSIREDIVAAGVELTRLLRLRIEGAPAEELQTLSEPQPQWRSGD
ncbi:LacI family transcriptional regulator [uncultured Devosia sp.]|uniref:LacI family transcriptional regulator n=1 Tax=uncultured Devosia sp. TaxID=211434 RepID=UPI002622F0CD|nr:LacI family transcriptional regulator [uncultured Devosia sp.]